MDLPDFLSGAFDGRIRITHGVILGIILSFRYPLKARRPSRACRQAHSLLAGAGRLYTLSSEDTPNRRSDWITQALNKGTNDRPDHRRLMFLNNNNDKHPPRRMLIAWTLFTKS